MYRQVSAEQERQDPPKQSVPGRASAASLVEASGMKWRKRKRKEKRKVKKGVQGVGVPSPSQASCVKLDLFMNCPV